MQLTYKQGRCTLSIDKVTLTDEAEYKCEARNEVGVASTWMELLVESKHRVVVALLTSLSSSSSSSRRAVFVDVLFGQLCRRRVFVVSRASVTCGLRQHNLCAACA